MRSFKMPTPEVVDKAVSMLGSVEHCRRFFNGLENPNWIAPLEERGFFKNPPSAMALEGGGKWHPQWQAAKYLVRMAKHSPEAVVRILARIETDNPHILADMVDAALAVPLDIAFPLAKQVSRLLDRGGKVYAHYVTGVCQLAEMLAGDVARQEDAFELARAYLFPKRGETAGPRSLEEYKRREAMKKLVPLLRFAKVM